MIIYGIVALAFSAAIGWLSGRLGQIHAAEEDLEREATLAQLQADAEASLPPSTPTAPGA